MGQLAQVQRSSASFREEKRLAALEAPVVSTGRLLYVAPDRLEKHTTAPAIEDLTVTGRSLVLDRPAEQIHYAFDLDRVPEVASLVEAIRGVLAGDLMALRAHYSVGLEGELAGWRLTLVPVEAPVKQLLKLVRIEGAGSTVRLVETVQPNGDMSRMVMTPDQG